MLLRVGPRGARIALRGVVAEKRRARGVRTALGGPATEARDSRPGASGTVGGFSPPPLPQRRNRQMTVPKPRQWVTKAPPVGASVGPTPQSATPYGTPGPVSGKLGALGRPRAGMFWRGFIAERSGTRVRWGC